MVLFVRCIVAPVFVNVFHADMHEIPLKIYPSAIFGCGMKPVAAHEARKTVTYARCASNPEIIGYISARR